MFTTQNLPGRFAQTLHVCVYPHVEDFEKSVGSCAARWYEAIGGTAVRNAEMSRDEPRAFTQIPHMVFENVFPERCILEIHPSIQEFCVILLESIYNT